MLDRIGKEYKSYTYYSRVVMTTVSKSRPNKKCDNGEGYLMTKKLRLNRAEKLIIDRLECPYSNSNRILCFIHSAIIKRDDWNSVS